MKHVTHRFYSITLHCCTNILYWYDQHKSMQFDNHNLFWNFQKSRHWTLPWENHRVRIEIKFSLNFLNRDYFDSSIFQIISCCLGFCLKRLFLTLLPLIFCTFFRTFAWLLNVIVSLLIQYTTKQFTITKFFLDPLTKIGITFFPHSVFWCIFSWLWFGKFHFQWYQTWIFMNFAYLDLF